MAEAFLMPLTDIQPSQLYIRAAKLRAIQAAPNLEALGPLPIKRLDGDVVLADGHTRALAAYLKGVVQVRVYWDKDDLDWQAYRICVAWCRQERIRTVADLAGRIVSADDYESLWLARCRRMHEELDGLRRRQ